MVPADLLRLVGVWAMVLRKGCNTVLALYDRCILFAFNKRRSCFILLILFGHMEVGATIAGGLLMGTMSGSVAAETVCGMLFRVSGPFVRFNTLASCWVSNVHGKVLAIFGFAHLLLLSTVLIDFEG
jgi:hypothetical protein